MMGHHPTIINENREGTIMKKITILGIDLAKSIFHLVGCDEKGKEVFRKVTGRSELKKIVMGLPPCLIGMEACGSASYWAREFQKMGHDVKLIPPQYVKPFVKTNKNDFNDALGICEAVVRPNMTFASIKTEQEQDIQSLHRIRRQVLQFRTAIINQIRGLLAEYGIVLGPSPKKVRMALGQHLAPESPLSPLAKSNFILLLNQLTEIEAHLATCDERIKDMAQSHPVCQRLMRVPGIGVLTATALLASIGDPARFRNGRQFAAWLGLVPRQHSSGGKNNLLGISKRGDAYLRTLLIHGGRAVAMRAPLKEDRRSRWVQELVSRRGMNIACVAVANKNARILWTMLAKGEEYRHSSKAS